eukprot:3240336-Prymnesium_polylepis.1
MVAPLKPLQLRRSPLDAALDAPLPEDGGMPCASFGQVVVGGFTFCSVDEFFAAVQKLLGELGPEEAEPLEHGRDEDELEAKLEYFRDHPEKLQEMAVA